jgi:hypothetical protein
VRASGGDIADIVRRNRESRLALMAFKRDSANLFQAHHDFSFEGHVGRSVSRRGRLPATPALLSQTSPSWGAATYESRCSAIHPEIPQCGTEGPRPPLSSRRIDRPQNALGEACLACSPATPSCASHGRGAACESRSSAIHPEIPLCGIEGLRPSLPRRQHCGTLRSGFGPRFPRLGSQAPINSLITMFHL